MGRCLSGCSPPHPFCGSGRKTHKNAECCSDRWPNLGLSHKIKDDGRPRFSGYGFGSNQTHGSRGYAYWDVGICLLPVGDQTA